MKYGIQRMRRELLKYMCIYIRKEKILYTNNDMFNMNILLSLVTPKYSTLEVRHHLVVTLLRHLADNWYAETSGGNIIHINNVQ